MSIFCYFHLLPLYYIYSPIRYHFPSVPYHTHNNPEVKYSLSHNAAKASIPPQKNAGTFFLPPFGIEPPLALLISRQKRTAVDEKQRTRFLVVVV